MRILVDYFQADLLLDTLNAFDKDLLERPELVSYFQKFNKLGTHQALVNRFNASLENYFFEVLNNPTSREINAIKRQIPEDVKSFVDNSFDIVNQIHSILSKQGKSQKDLADLLGKKESEISKWMQGTHNFTIRSISKIEIVLGAKLITTPLKSKHYVETKFIPVKVHTSSPTTSEENKNKWFKDNDSNQFQEGLKTA